MNSALTRPVAGRVGGLVAGSYPLADSYHHDQLAAELPELFARADRLVSAETGLSSPGSSGVVVVTRRRWVERNLESFARLLEPAERRIAERLERLGGRGRGVAVARQFVAVETGAVLGALSRRVLGQYELVVPGDEDADAVAFVGSNILSMERAHQLRPSEFRLWIALHEAAHRAQFVGVPWMRAHFLTLVDDLVGEAQPEPGRLTRVVSELSDARRQGKPMVDERGVLGLFASPAQRATLDRVQALMSLLEGHGHVVMDRIGSRLLRTQGRLSALLKARRHDARTAAFFRLTGLEMKLRQYELGERFVLAVEREAGWSTLDLAWREPGLLPTLDEIERPWEWLRRVA